MSKEALEPSRRRLLAHMALAGACLGLLVGLLEAALFYFVPRAAGLLHPDVRYVIWFLTPLVDLLTGALLGLIAGSIGALLSFYNPARTAIIAALGLGFVGAYIIWLLNWFRIGTGLIFPRQLEIRTAVFGFLVTFVVALLAFRVRWRHVGSFFKAEWPFSISRWGWTAFVIVLILAGGILFFATHKPQPGFLARASEHGATTSSHPNLVLITLDTVRADHLSCYGYRRPTTPHLDGFAARGVLFESVAASSSWTLPSLASIFTGLLPHQHGADWAVPLDDESWTLARILQSKGYETAGFNANPFYGLAGWGLDEGFDVYDDDSYTLRHNLAVTFVGQSALRFLYDRLIRYNRFDRRDAADLNGDVARWYHSRDPSRPFFLFINYMDAHRPYLPPAPYDHRFGKIPRRLLARLTAPLQDGHPRHPYTRQERQDLLNGYDNSLAYLDDQIGNLVRVIRSRPGGENTIFIVTSDHGEGFGEHGTYDHGWNLYSEVLRVPLILWGRGIPTGVRVPDLVPNRRLFATAIDLALGLKGSIAQASLAGYWTHHHSPPSPNGLIVSELVTLGNGRDPSSVSLLTSEWHFIQNSDGGMELFNCQRDPAEKVNAAANPEMREVTDHLRTLLEARIAYSVLPWRSLAYLTSLDKPGASFIQQITGQHTELPFLGPAIGSEQAYFSPHPPSQLLRTHEADQDLLRTLPYH
jgi:arylsulfatase A-like enzyme